MCLGRFWGRYVLVGSHSWWTFIALVCMLLYSLCAGIGLALGFQLFSCSIAKSPGMCSVRASSFCYSVLIGAPDCI